MPGKVNLQPSHFAMILCYLHDDMKGEETTFLQWENLLKVKPE